MPDETPDWSWTPDEAMPSEKELNAQVRASYGLAGGRAPPTTLTERQRQAVVWASHGLDLRGIGEEMGVTGAAVKSHLWGARRKLAAKNTAHTVAVALRLGLID